MRIFLLLFSLSRTIAQFGAKLDGFCEYRPPALNETSPRRLYLDLLKNVLTGIAYFGTRERTQHQGVGSSESLRSSRSELSSRVCGNDLPLLGLTMTGLRRMESLERTVRGVLSGDVRGELVECGVWQGGSSAYLLGLLREMGLRRRVWLADSFGGFAGLATMKEDAGFDGLPLDLWDKAAFIAVSKESVQRNLQRLNLFHHSTVRFQKGFFNVSLPRLDKMVKEISVLRMDGDLYESTMDILYNLYGKVSLGGLCRNEWRVVGVGVEIIVDDWWIGNCRRAVEEFREEAGIREGVVAIDQASAFWIKRRHVSVDPSRWRNSRREHFN